MGLYPVGSKVSFYACQLFLGHFPLPTKILCHFTLTTLSLS